MTSKIANLANLAEVTLRDGALIPPDTFLSSVEKSVLPGHREYYENLKKYILEYTRQKAEDKNG